MALNKFYIKKWLKMLSGKSILYVNQLAGTLYDKNKISGYYNNLTEKVLKSNLKENELPKTELPNGKYIEFSIAIFQYGLGAYDLYLETKKNEYYEKFITAVKWALNNQEENGGWVTFEYQSKKNPYSSMAQGEGVSLLLRGYVESKNERYLQAAKKAIDFLLDENNECILYNKNMIYFKEIPGKPVVLNGWIFSIFGLYDYILVTDDKKVENIFDISVETMLKELKKFDISYWSKYDIESNIASPFYHKLHIELLKTMYELTNEEDFLEYSLKFDKYQKYKINYCRAFIKKALQKIFE